MRVFLDANILFSAVLPGSAMQALVDALKEYGETVTSPHAVEEARRNLWTKRPAIVAGLDSLLAGVTVTHAFARDLDVMLPEHDIPILAGAVGSRCTHLLTGDKRHFGPLFGRRLHGVLVVSCTTMADILLAQGWNPKLGDRKE